MKVLVAEDDPDSRILLAATLESWGHEVVTTSDGAAAWNVLQRDDAPGLCILDWMMPELDGLSVCRRARARTGARPLYIILLSARGDRQDVVEGLSAGADDFVTKPFDRAELRARVGVGIRIVSLQWELAARVADLEQALARVDLLHGILPICSYCKKVRSESNSWQQVEAYVAANSAIRFSHGVCPECLKVLEVERDELRRQRALQEERKP